MCIRDSSCTVDETTGATIAADYATKQTFMPVFKLVFFQPTQGRWRIFQRKTGAQVGTSSACLLYTSYLQRVTLQEGATVEEAIRASGLLELRTDIDLTKNKVGIYSRPAKLSDIVHDGDRVEIYRPLIADPKELRRQRAEKSANK